jgi:hypothetical protein
MEGNTITRRQMLKGVGLFAGGTLLGSGLTLAGMQWESGTAQGAGSERPWYGLGIIGEPIMDGTAEEFTPGRAKKLYDALKCPKDYRLFTEEDTGPVHCQVGALNIASQRMFDWLDEHL